MRKTTLLRSGAAALALLAFLGMTTAMPAGADAKPDKAHESDKDDKDDKAEAPEKADKAESNGDADRTADATEHVTNGGGKTAGAENDSGTGGQATKTAGNEPATTSGQGTADVTVDVDCHTVSVTSTKDISHAVVHFADGTSQKFEGLSGHTWSMTFTRTLAGARAKSATTVVEATATGCASTASEADSSVADECADDHEMSANGSCTAALPGVSPTCPSGTAMTLDGSCAGDPVNGVCPSGTTMTDAASCVASPSCPAGSTMADATTCVDEVDVQSGADVDADSDDTCAIDAGMAAGDEESCSAALAAAGASLQLDDGEVAGAMQTTGSETEDPAVVRALSAGASVLANGALAFTGASITTLLLVGIVACAGGAALLVGSRRRRHTA